MRNNLSPSMHNGKCIALKRHANRFKIAHPLFLARADIAHDFITSALSQFCRTTQFIMVLWRLMLRSSCSSPPDDDVIAANCIRMLLLQ